MKLIGEGEYNLNILKEIKVTEDYLGLGKNIIKCQNEESLYNCTTRVHIKTLQNKCGCIPVDLRMSVEVCLMTLALNCVDLGVNSTQKNHSLMLQDHICSLKEVACVNKLKPDDSHCLAPCTGLILTGYSKHAPAENLEDLISEEVAQYNQYTKWIPHINFFLAPSRDAE